MSTNLSGAVRASSSMLTERYSTLRPPRAAAAMCLATASTS